MNAKELAEDMRLNVEQTVRLQELERWLLKADLADLDALAVKARTPGFKEGHAGATLVLIDIILDQRVAAAAAPKETP